MDEICISKGKSYFIFLSILLTVAIFAFGHVQYSEPDDYLFAAILNGVYGNGSNQIFLHPYVSLCLTSILAVFNSLFGIENIYGIFIIVVYCIIFIALHWLGEKIDNSLLFHVFVVVFQVLVSQYLTYTVLAYLLIGTSIFYFCMNAPNKKDDNKGASVVFFVLAVLGILMRGEVFLTTLILLLPSVVVSLIRQFQWKIIRNVVILFVISIGISSINTMIYEQQQDWNQYILWNKASTRIRDYSMIKYDEYATVLKEINWSENDLQLAYSWRFVDKNTFNETALDTLADNILITDRYNFNVFDIGINLLKQRSAVLLLLTMLLLCVLQLNRAGIYGCMRSFVAYLVPVLLLCALLFRKRYVERIAVPILILGIAQVILFFTSQRKKNRSIRSCLTVIPCVCFLLICLSNTINAGTDNSYRDVRNYLTETPQILFLTNSGLANELTTSTPIIDVSDECYYTNVIKLGSWDSYSKRYYDLAANYSIRDPDNMFYSLATEPQIRLLTNQADDLTRLQVYLSEHYQVEGGFVIEKQFENNVAVYRWVDAKETANF